MEHVVYCDESRHDANTNRFMTIGSLWLPLAERDQLSRSFRTASREAGLRGELKWKKVSLAKLDAYKKAVDFFFAAPSMRFRVIVVDLTRVNDEKFHENDGELGFYKFYYELLEKWISPTDSHVLLLDFKNNKKEGRYSKLREVLSNKHGKNAIAELTTIDSAETPLAQLADVLTGAVAASWNDQIRNAKESLAQYVATKAGKPSLKVKSATPNKDKFNIFAIELQD